MVEDVADDYVSIERAARDYGVVVREVDAELAEYEVDQAATAALRAEQRAARRGWLAEDAEDVARRYRDGELDVLDLVRHYGVIVDWGTGELFPTHDRGVPRDAGAARGAALVVDVAAARPR